MSSFYEMFWFEDSYLRHVILYRLDDPIPVFKRFPLQQLAFDYAKTCSKVIVIFYYCCCYCYCWCCLLLLSAASSTILLFFRPGQGLQKYQYTQLFCLYNTNIHQTPKNVMKLPNHWFCNTEYPNIPILGLKIPWYQYRYIWKPRLGNIYMCWKYEALLGNKEKLKLTVCSCFFSQHYF